MNIEEYREYCLSIKGVTESFPFDEHTLVYKIMDKMFTFAPLNPKGDVSGRIRNAIPPDRQN